MRLPTIREGLLRFLGYGGLVIGGIAGVNLSPTVGSVALAWQAAVIGVGLAGGAICTAAGRLREHDRTQQIGLVALGLTLLWVFTILLLSLRWSTLLFASIAWALAWFVFDRAVRIDTDARERLALKKRLHLPNEGDS